MSWDFESIPKYVINLDRRKDRWMQFQNTSGIDKLTNLRRWPGRDGKTINLDTDTNISLATKYNIVRGTRRSHMELNSKGGLGCYYSHTDVWKDFLEKSDKDVAIVFEDDTILSVDAVSRIKQFIDKSPVIKNTDMWDFCILSPYKGNKKQDPLYNDDPTCIRLVEFQGMTGYLINKKGVKKILPLIFPIQAHIDWFLSICAQLQYIELCCPPTSLLSVRLTRTDIQKTTDCEICDIETDFQKDHELVSKWRLRSFQIEELFLLLAVFYIGGRILKKF